MKQTLIFILSCLLHLPVWAQQQISFTWTGTLSNPTNTSVRWFSTEVTGGTYDIDWGDGQISENSRTSGTHIYNTDGEYTVTLTGDNNCSFIKLEFLGSTTLIINGVEYHIYDKVTSLDVSNAPTLVTLICSSHHITAIDMLGNSALKHLNLYGNRLASLDLSNCTLLETLDCATNSITSLILPETSPLKTIICTQNKITSLDVSNYNLLETLKCSNNQLTSLSVTENPLLKSFQCGQNQLTTLDISRNTSLEELHCGDNLLTSLDIDNSNLIELICSFNQINNLDITNAVSLRRIYCNANNLSSVNVSNNPELLYFQCNNNQLAELDLSTNNKLSYLYCGDNKLTLLKLSEGSIFSALSCQNNAFSLNDLYTLSQKEAGEYMALGTQIMNMQELKPGENIDFSDHAIINGMATEFEIQKDGIIAIPDTDYTFTDYILAFLSVGEYTVTMANKAITSDINHPAKVIHPITVSTITSIKNTIDRNVVLYTTAIDDHIIIEGLTINETLHFYSVNGHLLHTYKVKGETESITVSDLPSGMYILKTSNGKTLKWIKK